MSDEISADERNAGNRYLEAHRPGWSYLPGLSKLWEEAFAIGYAACVIYRGKRAVAEEPEGRRVFVAAYRARNGNVLSIGAETVVQEHAQNTVDEFSREDTDGPEYFVASRVVPPWVPVKQEGAE